jgi:hypothetical protein
VALDLDLEGQLHQVKVTRVVKAGPLPWAVVKAVAVAGQV